MYPTEKCPEPCVKLLTYFGYPHIQKNINSTGIVNLYFKDIVKVTEDFISYDLLRYYNLKDTFVKKL